MTSSSLSSYAWGVEGDEMLLAFSRALNRGSGPPHVLFYKDTKKCFLAGTLGAVCLMLFFALLRFAALTRMNIEAGFGGRLFVSSALGTLPGLLCFSLFGGVLALLFRLILRACGWNGIIPGAGLGVASWFLVSMLIGTFPSLDVLTPRGELPVGPMGVFGGKLTFYSLLFAHTAYGALIGWCLPPATNSKTEPN